MWISGTTQYALRAVLFVAEHGSDEPVRVDAIAAALNVPRNYLSKTLHTLARAGVLRSGRGPRGGFQLVDRPDEQGRLGYEGHVSRDGASPGERVRRRGGDIYVGESISYGFDDADDVVRQLIVDDGVPDRGHRRLLFTGDFRYAGVGCAEHRRLRHLCVVDLSGTADGAPAIPEAARARGARAFVYRGN